MESFISTNTNFEKRLNNKPFVTFRVTEDCNFRCKYCVLDFPKHNMSNEVIDSSINDIERIFKEANISEYDLVCTGGEPMTNIDAILHLLEVTPETSTLTVLTNGSLIGSLKKLEPYKHRVIISMSCDGKEESQLANRNKIISQEFINLAKTFKAFSFTFTVAPNNVQYMKESYQYLVSYDPAWIGMTVVYNAIWTDEEKKLLYKGLDEIFELETKNKPYLPFIYQYNMKNGELVSQYNCTNGKEFTVMYDGTFTKCHTELLIGNTIDKKNDSLEKIRMHDIHRYSECKECEYHKMCIECVVSHKNKLDKLFAESQLNKEQLAIVSNMIKFEGFEPNVHILCYYVQSLGELLNKYWDNLIVNYFLHTNNFSILKRARFYNGDKDAKY